MVQCGRGSPGAERGGDRRGFVDTAVWARRIAGWPYDSHQRRTVQSGGHHAGLVSIHRSFGAVDTGGLYASANLDARIALSELLWPAEERRDRSAGRDGATGDPAANQQNVSAGHRSPHERVGRTVARCDGGQNRTRAVDPDGRGRNRPVDRLRKCRESAAGAGDGTAAGACRAQRPGCHHRRSVGSGFR